MSSFAQPTSANPLQPEEPVQAVLVETVPIPSFDATAIRTTPLQATPLSSAPPLPAAPSTVADPYAGSNPASTPSQSQQTSSSDTANEHVGNLASAIGGAVLSAPLAALQAVSPALSEKVGAASQTIAGHAQTIGGKVYENLPTQAVAQEKANAALNTAQANLPSAETAKGYLAQAVDLATQAKDTTLSYVQGAANSTGLTTQEGRQDVSNKIGAAVTPDSNKTYTQAASDFVKGKADAAASYIQPESNKTAGQHAADTLNPNTHASHSTALGSTLDSSSSTPHSSGIASSTYSSTPSSHAQALDHADAQAGLVTESAKDQLHAALKATDATHL